MYLAVINYQSEPTAKQVVTVTMAKLTVYYNQRQSLLNQSLAPKVAGVAS